MRQPPSTTILPKGFVDLATAIDVAGRIEFPEEWNGEEVEAVWDWRYTNDIEVQVTKYLPDFEIAADLKDKSTDKAVMREAIKAELIEWDRERNQPRVRREEVTVKLRDFLYSGAIPANALLSSGRLMEIEPFFWAGIYAPDVFDSGVICIANGEVRAFQKGQICPEIAHVLTDHRALKASFQGEAPRKTKQCLASDVTRCIRWLEDLMRKSPEKRIANKETLRTKAQEEFSKLSGRGFDRAWDIAIEKTGANAWAKAGRLPGR